LAFIITISTCTTGYVWDVADGTQIRRLRPDGMIFNPVILINPDGTLIYRVIGKGLETWDWKSNDVTRIALEIGRSCDVAAVHPDGKRLLCADRSTTTPGLFLVDLKTGKQLKSYQSATALIYALAFNADGSRFATGEEHIFRIRETESGNILHSYRPDVSFVRIVAFNGDGSQLVTETRSGKFGVWDTRLLNRAILGETLLTRDDLPDNGFISDLVCLPSGDTLLEADSEGIYALDMHTNEPYLRIAVDAGVSSLALFPNGDILIGSSEGDLIRQSLSSEQPVWSMKAHSQPIESIAVSHDGLMLLTGGFDGFVRLWDAASGTQIDTFKVLIPYGVRKVAFTVDAGVAALGCVSIEADNRNTCIKREIQVWDLILQPQLV